MWLFISTPSKLKNIPEDVRLEKNQRPLECQPNSNALPTELRGKVCSSVWYISELSLVVPLIQMY